MQKSSKRVIIVNDAMAPLSWMLKALATDYQDIMSFTESAEALEYLQSATPPDLIIVDLHMPHIDGLKFCRLTRTPEFKTLNYVPVLIVSSHCRDDFAENITKGLGVSCFLQLPCDKETFLRSVGGMLQLEVATSQPKVLVIDDSDDVQNLLASVLSSHGHVVLKAKDAESGMKMTEKHTPDIVILDHVLPDATGLTLIPSIKKNNNPIVIAITGQPTSQLAIDYACAGAESYIQKPISAVYLIDLINKIYRERSILHVEQLLGKRTEDLRRSKAEYTALADDVEKLVCRYRPDFKMVFANTNFCETTQISSRDILKHKFTELLNGPVQKSFPDSLALLTKENPMQTDELQLKTEDTSIRVKWITRVITSNNDEPLEY